MKKEFVKLYIIYFLLLCCVIFEAHDTLYAQNDVNVKQIDQNITLSSPENIVEDDKTNSMTNIERYNHYLKSIGLVAHAGGQIDDKYYTNSLESLENSYNNGYRIIEVDMSMTSDNKLVLTHGFEKYDYMNKMGLSFNKKTKIMSYKAFMNSKLFGKYTTVDANKLIEFMKEHDDVYIIPDIKNGDNIDVVKDSYKQLVEAAQYDEQILNRIIGTFLSANAYKAVSSIYNFEITNIHNRVKTKMEKNLNSNEKFVEFCISNNIKTVTMDKFLYNIKLAKLLNDADINIILFTVDNQKSFNSYLDLGVTAVMTNSIKPNN